MRDTDDPRNHWITGMPVTSAHDPELIGAVKKTFPRKTDGRVFTRIALPTGEVWANRGEWLLGTGQWVKRCLDCEQSFRTDDAAAGFCLACLPYQRPDHDEDARTATEFPVRRRSEERGQGRRRG